jgi:hypothetical protein
MRGPISVKQRRDDHRADDEGVQQDAESHDDAELSQHNQRQHTQHAEHRGQHDARAELDANPG